MDDSQQIDRLPDCSVDIDLNLLILVVLANCSLTIAVMCFPHFIYSFFLKKEIGIT